jgi:hypothetical protein
MNWQPIETAPKDDVLHVRGLIVRNLASGAEWWEAICGRMEDGDFVDHDGNAPWRAEDYTHWLPLPEPPAE